jgi:PPOX class probable FMN-dependent enzyme
VISPQTVTGSEFLGRVEQLRELYDRPKAAVLAVRKPALDQHHRRIIAKSPLMVLATADADGQPAASPKGGEPGFVRVLDNSTLLMADRPGNNNIRGLSNLMENPKVALLFFVPGINEVLRVEGTARVVRDEAVLAELEAYGRRPKTATLIDVELAYVHCGKALVRSKVWEADSRPEPDSIPTLGQMLVDDLAIPASVEEVDASIQRTYQQDL